MSGWKLSAALFVKQIHALGDTVASALASFDPETATEVDRDNLKAKLRDIATKLAEARRKYDFEKKEADDLAAQIALDEKTAAILIAKFEAGQVDEATLNEFANNLEAMKARLPSEQQDATDAKELVDTLEGILKTIEQKLSDFDANAQKALRAIAQAKADKERETLRLQGQEEMRQLKSGLGSTSTALGALNKKAAQLRVQADATAIQADIGQKPLDRQNAVEEARRIAAGTAAPAAESAADRLRRLTGK
jgi:myosin heavy subunit